MLEFDLDDLSIEMHSIRADSSALITMNYSEFPLLGKYIITEVESPDENNAEIKDISSDPILLSQYNSLCLLRNSPK